MHVAPVAMATGTHQYMNLARYCINGIAVTASSCTSFEFDSFALHRQGRKETANVYPRGMYGTMS